ncbi:MAG: HEAT repeat domain-containing protein [Aureliella sp.]
MTFQLNEIEELHNQPERIGSALVELVESLRAGDEEIASGVADVCGTLDVVNPVDSVNLISFCNEEHPVVALWACRLLVLSLGQSSEHDAVAEQAFVKALVGHRDIGVQQQAAIALGKLERKCRETVDALRVAAESEDPRLSRLAGRALEHCQDDAA